MLGPRVLIVGCSGAGKSTLARRLGGVTDHKVVHLDQLFWNPGWRMDRAAYDLRLGEELAGENWILDGNYDSSLARRLERATDVLVLEGCPERLDWEFVKWIWNFRRDTWPATEALLAEGERRGVRLHRFRKPRELERFLRELAGLLASFADRRVVGDRNVEKELGAFSTDSRS
jgi:energy-coupling factor transporter ATP-binding protein EcfA2